MKRVYRPFGERDFEITLEMIRAGRRELTDDVARDLYDGFLNPEDVAVSVYRAMLQAHENRSKSLAQESVNLIISRILCGRNLSDVTLSSSIAFHLIDIAADTFMDRNIIH